MSDVNTGWDERQEALELASNCMDNSGEHTEDFYQGGKCQKCGAWGVMDHPKYNPYDERQ